MHAARYFAGGIESGNHRTFCIENLCFAVNLYAPHRVVHGRREDSGIERPLAVKPHAWVTGNTAERIVDRIAAESIPICNGFPHILFVDAGLLSQFIQVFASKTFFDLMKIGHLDAVLIPSFLIDLIASLVAKMKNLWPG